MPDLRKLADLTRADLHDVMSPATLRKRIQAGEVPHRLINGRIYIDTSTLDELLRGRLVPARRQVRLGGVA